MQGGTQLEGVVGAEDAALARWLTLIEHAHADATGRRIWQVFDNPTFATLWYDARDAGERLRASALKRLYGNRAHPGGHYPDPREPASFSQRAILSAAATSLGVAIQLLSAPSTIKNVAATGLTEATDLPDATQEHKATKAAHARIRTASAGRMDTAGNAADEPRAWLVTYPKALDKARDGWKRHDLEVEQDDDHPPTIMVQEVTPRTPLPRMHFQIACMLGYVSRERARLLDVAAPHGISLMPSSPSDLAALHQFATALLCLEPACPDGWSCPCNAIRRRFNAPPPDHPQDTDTMTLAELAEEEFAHTSRFYDAPKPKRSQPPRRQR